MITLSVSTSISLVVVQLEQKKSEGVEDTKKNLNKRIGFFFLYHMAMETKWDTKVYFYIREEGHVCGWE